MRQIFLEYAKSGVMTKEELAKVLKMKPSHVGELARQGKLPRIPGIRLIRFDPMKLIEVLCEPQSPDRGSSLTIERHKTKAKTNNGGYRKCL